MLLLVEVAGALAAVALGEKEPKESTLKLGFLVNTD